MDDKCLTIGCPALVVGLVLILLTFALKMR